MAAAQLGHVLRHIRNLIGARSETESTDGQLLERFAVQREEAAFGALLQRYGPLVLGLCRRMLPDAQDAEDAFQATFLVLARKAASIRRQQSVGSWLYGVAHRTALRSRAATARRQAHEESAGDASVNPQDLDDPSAAADRRELRRVLDEEVQRLPAKYRLPVLLCYLDGKTNEEAATQLGWPKGTVQGRLARARDLLQGRLTRRGVALSAAALGLWLAENAVPAAVPAALGSRTLRAALGFASGNVTAAVSAPVACLAEGTLKAMFIGKVKLVSALLLLAMIGSGATLFAYHELAAEPFRAQPVAGPKEVSWRKTATLGPVGPDITSLTFSPDGRTLAATDNNNVVELWDVARNQRLTSLNGSSVAFSPDGKTLAVGMREGPKGSEGAVQLYDQKTMKPTVPLKASVGYFDLLAFSPDGKLLAARDGSNRILVWRLLDRERQPQVIQNVAFHEQEISRDRKTSKNMAPMPVSNFAFSDDSTALAIFMTVRGGSVSLLVDPPITTTSYPKTAVALWDVTTNKERSAFTCEGPREVTALVFSADGRSVAVAVLGEPRFPGQPGDVAVRVYEVKTGRSWMSLPNLSNNRIVAVAFAPTGGTLATRTTKGDLILWEAVTGRERAVLMQPDNKLNALPGQWAPRPVAFAPNGKRLAASRDLRFIDVWELGGPPAEKK
jgi:RNA polymerase sigma factor (sigma-70 family)